MEFQGCDDQRELEPTRDTSHKALILQDGLAASEWEVQKSPPRNAASMYELVSSGVLHASFIPEKIAASPVKMLVSEV